MPTSKARKERRAQRQLVEGRTAEAEETIKNTYQTLGANPNIQVREIEGKGRGLVWAPADGKVLTKGEPRNEVFSFVA